jgi:protein ImuA
MPTDRQHIIKQLRKDILSLQGLKRLPGELRLGHILGPINTAFPDNSFPLASVHEFLVEGNKNRAATSGFISCITSAIMRNNGVSVWISSSQTVFPPALKAFNINPDKIIFITGLNQKDRLWVMEEALKCDALTAVIGEVKDIDFTTSRRFQLAVEQSRVTGFIIGEHLSNLSFNSCVSRWQINSISAETQDNLPGIGFPRWKVELLKIRNGKPGNWEVTWAGDHLEFSTPMISMVTEKDKRKVG